MVRLLGRLSEFVLLGVIDVIVVFIFIVFLIVIIVVILTPIVVAVVVHFFVSVVTTEVALLLLFFNLVKFVEVETTQEEFQVRMALQERTTSLSKINLYLPVLKACL